MLLPLLLLVLLPLLLLKMLPVLLLVTLRLQALVTAPQHLGPLGQGGRADADGRGRGNGDRWGDGNLPIDLPIERLDHLAHRDLKFGIAARSRPVDDHLA